MEFKKYGDSALLINFEQVITRGINAEVLALSAAIQAAKWEGVRFVIPAYCSLTVGYDNGSIGYADLCEKIMLIEQELTVEKLSINTRKLSIPVCYEPPYSIDHDELVEVLGMPFDEIIHIHTSTVFHMYMMGFLPGFAYMGKWPEGFSVPRKSIPRANVPALSVGLAGQQTGIYPVESPGGWQIIGQTPIPVFIPHNNEPFLFMPGDEVRFYSISSNLFQQIKEGITEGCFNYEEIYG